MCAVSVSVLLNVRICSCGCCSCCWGRCLTNSREGEARSGIFVRFVAITGLACWKINAGMFDPACLANYALIMHSSGDVGLTLQIFFCFVINLVELFVVGNQSRFVFFLWLMIVCSIASQSFTDGKDTIVPRRKAFLDIIFCFRH